MSRWVNVDALKNKLQQHHDFFVNAWGGFREMPIQDKARCDELSNSIAEILNAPSIDLVRCGECKYWQDNNGGYPTTECRWGHDETPDADDFCSYGERKESE